MKIHVRHEKCQGHARCWTLAPDVYRLDDSGYVLPGDIDVPAGQEALAQRGGRACPERALEIVADA